MEKPAGVRRTQSRPLRTYSKRPIASDDTEPPLKRRRTDPGTAAGTPLSKSPGNVPTRQDDEPERCRTPTGDTIVVALSPSPEPPQHAAPRRQDAKPKKHQPPTSDAKKQPPKKGSILNYFKVTSPSSSSLSSDTKPSGAAAAAAAAAAASTPPSAPVSSSPPAIEALPPSSTSPSMPVSSSPPAVESLPPSSPPAADSPPSSSPPAGKSRRRKRRLTTRPISESPTKDQLNHSTNTDTSPETPSPALGTTGASRLNQQETPPQSGAEAANTKRRKPKQATVQTTISLSAHDKGFVECRDCKLVYNPFHGKDFRYHAKRHAAMVTRKSAAEEKAGAEAGVSSARTRTLRRR